MSLRPIRYRRPDGQLHLSVRPVHLGMLGLAVFAVAGIAFLVGGLLGYRMGVKAGQPLLTSRPPHAKAIRPREPAQAVALTQLDLTAKPKNPQTPEASSPPMKPQKPVQATHASDAAKSELDAEAKATLKPQEHAAPKDPKPLDAPVPSSAPPKPEHAEEPLKMPDRVPSETELFASTKPRDASQARAAPEQNAEPPPETEPAPDEAEPESEPTHDADVGPEIHREVPKSGFGLQLGSFPSEAEALTFVKRQEAIFGEPVYLVKHKLKNRGHWFRVRLGRFKSLKQARARLQKLPAPLKDNAILVEYR